MASQVMRITLKAYDHQLIDSSAAKIIETVKKTDKEGSYHDSPCGTQIQRFERTVRAEDTQEADRYHCPDAEDR